MHDSQITLGKTDLEMACALIDYLKSQGVPFHQDGFPVNDQKWFLKIEPSEVLPFYQRSVCTDPSTTAICFNETDDHLYTRIRQVFQELPEYKRFLGVLPMDLSVSRFMIPEVQNFNLLLNALFLATLGVNGVKFASPVRFGSIHTIPYFSHYRGSFLWSIGCVGTKNNGKVSRRYEEYNRSAFLLLMDRPKKLLAYGKMHPEEKLNWESNGVPVSEYIDYNERSRRGDLKNVR